MFLGGGRLSAAVPDGIWRICWRNKTGRPPLPRNVCEAVRAPRNAKREMRTLDPAQVRALLEAAKDDRLEVLYVLAVSAGLREGELLGLRWE